ncbi:AtaL-like protein [Scytonema sp. PCC 10023]|uniref:AtaL-like protein n=1 Tax=Scytonema sp. PCC 10023 TaxID=1680591 RepID=UPI0039C73C7E
MLYSTFSTSVNTTTERVWNFLLDKMERPQQYIPYEVEEFKIWERYDDGILREIKTSEMHMTERTTVDKQAGKITFTLVEHPLFTGQIINQVTSPVDDNPGSFPILTYTFDIKPTTEKAEEKEEAQWFIRAAQPEMIKEAVLHMKSIIEDPNTKPGKSMSESFTGEKIDIVKHMFKAGESMNVENFVKFYTDDALYQFSNFPVVYGPQGIRDASVDFLKNVEQVYHHMKNMWEVGDTVVAEMEVTYIRYDGKVFTLPCCDTIRFKGDKVQELRIYMDISAVFV